MSKDVFKATTIHRGGTKVKIQARSHEIIADEPKELGGTDTGANPVELLLGALGACQSVVAQVYSEKFDVEYDELRIELEGDIDLDGFLDKADVRPGYSEIRLKYYFKTNEPLEKLQPFVDFVQTKCPVGDTIANAVSLKGPAIRVEAIKNKVKIDKAEAVH